MTRNQSSIGISKLAYRLPSQQVSVQQLVEQKLTVSSATVLTEFGFSTNYLLGPKDTLIDLLTDTGLQILKGETAQTLGLDGLILYSGLQTPIAQLPESPITAFRYPVAQIHHKLQLNQVPMFALTQQGCSGLLQAITLAERLLETSDQPAYLILTGDALPKGSRREIMYNLMSDAAAGLVVQKNSPHFKLIHYTQEVESYYWDSPERETELLASYFPLARKVIERALREAGLSLSDVAWFVPHNVSGRSWEILSELLKVPREKIWTQNIARIGHTVSADHVINLVDMETAGLFKSGDYLVLFTFGFGAVWSCLILQY